MSEELRRDFNDKGIKKVKVGGFDVDGVLRGKYVSLEKFWSALDKGFGFCDVIFGWDVSDQLYDNAKVTGWDSGSPRCAGHGELHRRLLHAGRRTPSRLPAQSPQERDQASRRGWVLGEVLRRVRVLGFSGDATVAPREGFPRPPSVEPR
ncbi:MAG: hypothetical protein JRD92_12460, partial [Deltaproteobacteria bacterium]|nr:hypothetical protein [Deltaproteobacteria bacterium]